jgi:hypothetical protein
VDTESALAISLSPDCQQFWQGSWSWYLTIFGAIPVVTHHFALPTKGTGSLLFSFGHTLLNLLSLAVLAGL